MAELQRLDDFGRADSATLGASWTEGPCGFAGQGNLSIEANGMRGVAGTFEQFAYWSGVQGSDLSGAFRIRVMDGRDYDPVGLAVEVADTTNGYEFYLRNPTSQMGIYRKTTLDSTISLSEKFQVGDSMGWRANDNGSSVALEVWKQHQSKGPWAQIGSGTASVRIAGPYYPGCGVYNNTVTVIDDFWASTGSGAFSGSVPLHSIDLSNFPKPKLRG